MITAALFCALWFLLSIPFGMFVGKCVGYCDHKERR